MEVPSLPAGFLAAGRNVGIKNRKRDCGVLLSDGPATYAACVTRNRSRAANTARLEAIRDTAAPVRALLTVSGNANALTGEAGVEDDRRLAEATARQLGIETDEVLTAYTGVVGHRLPTEKVEGGLPAVLAGLTDDPTTFAESTLTTDKVIKVEAREIFVGGHRVQIHAVAKGSGMISPALATTLVFVTTDCAIRREMLQAALTDTVDATLNQLTVDAEMSTNDAVVALANGYAENPEITETNDAYDVFAAALHEIFEALTRAIADDGEGATRRIEVMVSGAATLEDARAFGRAVASSVLVKAALFGADPNMAGRILATLGAAATRRGAALDLEQVQLQLQGMPFFHDGAMRRPSDAMQVRFKLREPVVEVALTVGDGPGEARAYGCDLSYDYVKINADYAAITQTTEDGRVGVDERLAELGPSIKRKLLVEALRYIDRFRGMRAVIKLGGAAMLDPRLEQHFAEDVLLLQSVGLRPIVVHGGGPEISRTMERLGQTPKFVDGLRVSDRAAIGTVEMVLTGSVNQRLVTALNREGARAVGLSGKDGGLLRARPHESAETLGNVGEVDTVDPRLLEMLEDAGYIPVVSPVGLGPEGSTLNLNSDVVAAELAAAIGASKLIFLFDRAGLMEGDQVLSELHGDQLKRRLDAGQITGFMYPKLQAALRALRGGLQSVHLVDGRVRHNLIAELFTDRGVGTLIRQA